MIRCGERYTAVLSSTLVTVRQSHAMQSFMHVSTWDNSRAGVGCGGAYQSSRLAAGIGPDGGARPHSHAPPSGSHGGTHHCLHQPDRHQPLLLAGHSGNRQRSAMLCPAHQPPAEVGGALPNTCCLAQLASRSTPQHAASSLDSWKGGHPEVPVCKECTATRGHVARQACQGMGRCMPGEWRSAASQPGWPHRECRLGPCPGTRDPLAGLQPAPQMCLSEPSARQLRSGLTVRESMQAACGPFRPLALVESRGPIADAVPQRCCHYCTVESRRPFGKQFPGGSPWRPGTRSAASEAWRRQAGCRTPGSEQRQRRPESPGPCRSRPAVLQRCHSLPAEPGAARLRCSPAGFGQLGYLHQGLCLCLACT